jgi:hypothetical protein
MTPCAATISTSASLASLPEWLGLVLHPYIPDRCVASLSLVSRNHHEALLPVWKQMLMQRLRGEGKRGGRKESAERRERWVGDSGGNGDDGCDSGSDL